jgi:hypothetical protein
MTQRKELSYDGFGINGPDEFRSRIATFAPTCEGEERDRYGKLFERAPDMLRVLSTMVGMAEADGLDSISNCWRSAMLEADTLIEGL